MSLELKPKQQSVVDIINDCPRVDTIYLIGAVNLARQTLRQVSASIFVTHLRKTYWTVFRKNIALANDRSFRRT